ncbi:MAG: undecaprenyl-diphosphate phosphatase [Nitrospirales bacterium]
MDQWGPALAAMLGVVEGLTEFLPVSSTGHLILVGHVLGFTGAVAVSVEISIQLGSILAVVVYERAKLGRLVQQAVSEQAGFRALLRTTTDSRGLGSVEAWTLAFRRSADRHPHLWFLVGLGVAFLPAAGLGLLAHDWIEAYLFHPHTVAAALIGGGLVILLVETVQPRVRTTSLIQVRVRTAWWVGVAQCAALFPGVSRSGATIVGGLLGGLERSVATEYSFFLALPTMIAATTYKLVSTRHLFTAEDLLALGLGLLVSFLVAWGVIAAFLAFVKRHTLRAFAYYRIALGTVVFAVFQ